MSIAAALFRTIRVNRRAHTAWILLPEKAGKPSTCAHYTFPILCASSAINLLMCSR